MDKFRIDKLLAIHCMLGIAHEGGNTIVDGAHLRSWAETEMLLDSLQPHLMLYTHRLAHGGGALDERGGAGGHSGAVASGNPLLASAVASRTRVREVPSRLAALDHFIDRVFREGPQAIEAALRQDIEGFDEALDRLVLDLARDAARIARQPDMLQGTTPQVLAS